MKGQTPLSGGLTGPPPTSRKTKEMAMPMENQENEMELVERMEPIDTTGFRDPGMRALVVLAANLGWGVVVKPNNPALIIAPDGTQKRLPTNTSIRMSVFQTALSTIIAHADLQPGVGLIDEIVKTTKLSVDHARRMYLAIGESPKQHRERVATEAAKGTREPEPLTQRIEVPENIVATDTGIEWVDLPPDSTNPMEGPADGGDHGKLLDERPFMAHHHADKSGRVKTYQSDTSNERTWEDGFKDYTCMVCGRAYKTPKGVGSHRQYHIKDGAVPADQEPAWKRADKRGEELGWTPTTVRRSSAEIAAERMPPPVIDEEPMTDAEWKPFAAAIGVEVPEATTLDMIRQIVAADLVEERDRLLTENGFLTQELEQLRREHVKLTQDWDALKELLGGR